MKRALSMYCLRNIAEKGTAYDIHHIINEEYGIDVPILIVRKLIKSAIDSLSRREKNKI